MSALDVVSGENPNETIDRFVGVLIVEGVETLRAYSERARTFLFKQRRFEDPNLLRLISNAEFKMFYNAPALIVICATSSAAPAGLGRRARRMKDISQNVVVELLRRYGIHPPVTDERYLRHAELDRGYRLTLEVKEDGDRPHIVLRHGEAEASRIIPLSEFAARAMVDEFCEASTLPALSARARATLAHVLDDAARLYSEEQLASLRFEPLYLREKDYGVTHVQAQAKKKLRLKKRLMATTHDAGAVFAYRPTARLR